MRTKNQTAEPNINKIEIAIFNNKINIFISVFQTVFQVTKIVLKRQLPHYVGDLLYSAGLLQPESRRTVKKMPYFHSSQGWRRFCRCSKNCKGAQSILRQILQVNEVEIRKLKTENWKPACWTRLVSLPNQIKSKIKEIEFTKE